MARLQAQWRATGRAIIHVQHLSTEPQSPLRPGQPGVEIKPEVRPQAGEPVVQQHVSSAFIGTSLEADLRRQGLGATSGSRPTSCRTVLAATL